MSAPPPELGQVGHGGELVGMVHSKVLRMHHLRDVQVLLGQGHGIPHILQPVLGLQEGMVWNEAPLPPPPIPTPMNSSTSCASSCVPVFPAV